VLELFAQDTRRARFDFPNELGGCPTRVGLKKQVNVIWHHVESVDLHAAQCRRLSYQLDEPLFHQTGQDRLAVFRAPDNVVFEAENSPAFLAYRASSPSTPR